MPPIKRKPQYLPGPTPKKRVKPDPPAPITSNTPAPATPAAPIVNPWAHPYATPPSVQLLREWFEEQDMWIHDALEIRDDRSDGEGGLGIYAKGAVGEQTVVCKIPRTAILSHRSCPLRTLLPPSTTRQLPPIVLLSLSLLYELRLSTLSKFHGYVQSLPRKVVPLVAFWNVGNLGPGSGLGGQDGREGSDLLKGTEVTRELNRISRAEHSLSDLEIYHRATATYFPSTELCPEAPSLGDLVYAYSLVSSRAFGVDVFHGSALVPLADAFNHRDPPGNHVHFESDDFVCEECGYLPACSHDELVDGSSLPPIAAAASATPSVSTTTTTMLGSTPIPARLAHLPREIIQSFSHPSQQTLDMMCVRPFVSGEEVFNTYGERMGWAKMLVEWGFVDEGPHGGEALGEGMRWELKDVLRVRRGEEGRGPSDGKDEEDEDELEEKYDFKKKVFKKVIKSYPALPIHTGSPVPGPEEGHDDAALIYSPDRSLEPKESLLINGNGQISDYLLLALLVNHLTSSSSEVTDDESVVDPSTLAQEALLEFDRMRGCLGFGEVGDGAAGSGGRWTCTKGRLVAVLEMMTALINQRVEGTSRPGASVAELLDELDVVATSPDRPLTRMALKLLIEERRVCEVVASRVDELRRDLEADGESGEIS